MDNTCWKKGELLRSNCLLRWSFKNDFDPPIGTLALERGWLTPAQIKTCSSSRKEKLCALANWRCELGLLNQAQVDAMLQHDGETRHRVRLGEALVLKGFITLESLDRELKEYQQRN